MSSFIGDIANAFRFGTMTNPVERNVNGIIGIVGVVASVAIAILGAPFLFAAISAAIFGGLVVSAITESKGIAYASYIALTGALIAASILFPPPVVFY